MRRHETPTNDHERTETETSTPPTDSSGWRAEYAAQEVEPPVFDSNDDERERDEPHDYDTKMRTQTCPFCGWTGAANDYPNHLTGCDRADEATALADGGVDLPERGDERTDREASSGDRVLVLDVHTDAHADTWLVDAIDDTVAAVNPEYPDDDPVVEAVYVDALEDVGIADRSPDEVEHAAELGESGVYHFPASRLAAVDEVKA